MAEMDAAPPGACRIPILQTLEAAYRDVFSNLKHVYLLAWKPFAVAIAVGFICGVIDGALRRGPILSGTLGVLAGYWSNAYFALAFHRYQLFGWTPETAQVRLRFGRAEQIFLLFATGVYLIYGLGPALLAQAGTAVLTAWLLLTLAVIPLLIAVALGFPAAAEGHPRPLAFGWALGHGARLRIFAVEALCIIPGLLVTVVLEPLAKAQPVIASLVLGIVSYPFTAACIAALCRMYRIRTGAPPPEASPR